MKNLKCKIGATILVTISMVTGLAIIIASSIGLSYLFNHFDIAKVCFVIFMIVIFGIVFGGIWYEFYQSCLKKQGIKEE